jgi:hypothetical protein
MWPLAHLGIGSAMGRVGSQNKLPFRWLLLGTLLPDLVDRPFYFGLGVYEHFSNGGWVPGKRGFAHTALFLLLLTGIAVVLRSAPLMGWSFPTLSYGLHRLWAVALELIGLALLLVQLTVKRYRPAKI